MTARHGKTAVVLDLDAARRARELTVWQRALVRRARLARRRTLTRRD